MAFSSAGVSGHICPRRVRSVSKGRNVKMSVIIFNRMVAAQCTHCSFNAATVRSSVYKEHTRAHNEATDTKQSLLMHTLAAAALPAPIPKRVDSGVGLSTVHSRSVAMPRATIESSIKTGRRSRGAMCAAVLAPRRKFHS